MTATSEQIEGLMDFMSQHQEFARGIVHSIEGRAKSKRLWENLAAQLNSQGGSIKTVQHWKKVWADKKYLAKKANAAARRSATGTGGGPPTAELLSQNDLKVISIMGEGFGEPDIPACRLPAFPEPTPTETEDPLEQPLLHQEYVPNESPPAPAIVQAQPEESSTASLPTSRRPRRRLRLAGQSDMRSRIFRLEEEKKELLAGILGELRELNKTITNLKK